MRMRVTLHFITRDLVEKIFERLIFERVFIKEKPEDEADEGDISNEERKDCKLFITIAKNKLIHLFIDTAGTLLNIIIGIPV